jgi:hypothetical protein
MADPTEKELELKRKMDKLRSDFEAYARIAIKIKNKENGAMVPFILNTAQRLANGAFEQQLALTGSIRSIMLKGRQQGGSTLISGRGGRRGFMYPGQSIFTVAHDSQATTNLFNMVKRTYDNLPGPLKPKMSSYNVRELFFKELDSQFRVGTAGSAQVGRSMTTNFLHCSELAFWDNADALFAGIVQTVPPGRGSEIYIESTANGVGNKYHQMWVTAERGESDYQPIFIPWYLQNEYRKAITKPLELTDEELTFQKLYNIDEEQINYRRSKVSEIGSDLFKQEYPFNPTEAFLSSGRLAFGTDSLALALQETWSPKRRLLLENDKWVERKDGELRIWQEPQSGHRYVIGADVAEGVAGGDYSSADVLDIANGHQVAHFHGHCAPDVFARALSAMGKRYNNALVAVESNNHGLSTLIALRDKFRYSNLYAQTTLDDRGSDSKETKKLGFNTNRRTKPYIIDLLSALFREQDTGIACKETILECQTYVVLDDGSYGATVGCHDDRVMSYAIACYVLQLQPAYKKAHRY